MEIVPGDAVNAVPRRRRIQLPPSAQMAEAFIAPNPMALVRGPSVQSNLKSDLTVDKLLRLQPNSLLPHCALTAPLAHQFSSRFPAFSTQWNV